MPTSNAIALVAPKPLPSKGVNNSNDSSQDDAGPSFQQTLDSARKSAQPVNKPEKPTAKKSDRTDSGKRAKVDKKQDSETDADATTTASKKGGDDDETATPVKPHDKKKEDHAADAEELAAITAQGQTLITPAAPKTEATDANKAMKAEKAATTAKALTVGQATAASSEETGKETAAVPVTNVDTGAKQAVTAQAVAGPLVKQGAGIGTAKVKAVGIGQSEQSDTLVKGKSSATASEGDAEADTDADGNANAASSFNTIMQAVGGVADGGDKKQGDSDLGDSSKNVVAAMSLPSQLAHPDVPTVTKVDVPLTPAAQFAAANHPTIVTGVQGQLLPNGGMMLIRLDPPELGALQVTVHMRDGVMTAAFETSNDDATRLLSHSLDQLKTTLESAGVNVEKLHVQQSPRQDFQGNKGDQRQQQGQDQQQARQEQQRREMLQRMWRKLSGGGDPLDMVA